MHADRSFLLRWIPICYVPLPVCAADTGLYEVATELLETTFSISDTVVHQWAQNLQT